MSRVETGSLKHQIGRQLSGGTGWWSEWAGRAVEFQSTKDAESSSRGIPTSHLFLPTWQVSRAESTSEKLNLVLFLTEPRDRATVC